MQSLELIAKKRDGVELRADEIEFLVSGFARGDIPDYQVAAWLMAVFIRGMSRTETSALTLAMAHSGDVLDLSDVKLALAEDERRNENHPSSRPLDPVRIADKHSTGGVGDKTTIAVAPLVAACGVPVGKMSGRGLGHTGGTLDKLEAIPGFKTELSIEQFRAQLRHVGIVLAGQTHDLAPADGRLYALRDVTATVGSMPLIASSIMSKKIAAGADAIVLDVKVGRGAFMQTEPEALALARTMVEIGQGVGRLVSAVIADMNQPLGCTVGNALEVMEAIDVLTPAAYARTDVAPGEVPGVRAGPDLVEHCLAVASEMLQLVGRAVDAVEARRLLRDAIESGHALQKFKDWVSAQGGDARVATDFSILPRAGLSEQVRARTDGFVSGVDALAVGLGAMRLGAGRTRKGDPIDPAVGVVLHKKIGDRVMAGEPLCTIYANDSTLLRAEREALWEAYTLRGEPVQPPTHIHRIVR